MIPKSGHRFSEKIMRHQSVQVRLEYRTELTLVKATARKSSSRAVFPTPGHDHDRCASDAIAHAEATCAAHKERLTPVRRRVLEALLASHAPLGAYELIDRLADDGEKAGARPAPITIYR